MYIENNSYLLSLQNFLAFLVAWIDCMMANFFTFHLTVIIDLVEVVYYVNHFKQVFHLLSKLYEEVPRRRLYYITFP